FTLAQLPHAPHAYREVLAALENTHAEEGLDIRAGVPWRPPGVLLGLEATLNPFALHPSYAAVRKLPLPERVRALRDPTLRARLAAEETEATNPVLKRILSDGTNLFPLGDPPDYEPPASACVASRAKAAGVSMTELLLDLLTANEGRDYLYFPLSYVDRDFSVLHEMLSHPRSTASLSDGGAHVGSICDASVTSYMMSYWARDRQRGPQLPLEEVIRKQTSETAALYGLRDRGVVAPGKKADLNVVDFDGLRLHRPVATRDLPAGGRRLMQRAEGYRATVVSGQVIAEHGELTGARPGQLVRGAQA
ncbi:MAG: amidohydrolase family protein, partial [Myxococcota bacterium]